MKKLINRILNHFGYVPKSESISYSELTNILDSYDCNIYVTRIASYLSIGVNWFNNIELFQVSEDRKTRDLDIKNSHKYIYDRGVKAIIEENKK